MKNKVKKVLLIIILLFLMGDGLVTGIRGLVYSKMYQLNYCDNIYSLAAKQDISARGFIKPDTQKEYINCLNAPFYKFLLKLK